MLSVVVLVVDDFSVCADESKRDAPVATDPHGPGTFPFTLEGMEPKAGKSHVFSSDRGVQATQDQAQPFGMRGLDPGLGSRLKELGLALVLEAADHETQCNLSRYG